ncbi:MAG: YraN family protein [Christensenellales bacterium]|jgi:putative endonuclease
MNKRQIGISGEQKAVKYLRKQGYKILDVNIKNHAGEMDIAAEINGIIVFIEVKVRSDDSFGTPAEAVNRYKIRRYINSAKLYINMKKLANRDIRFDVIEISPQGLNHIIDAFRA